MIEAKNGVAIVVEMVGCGVDMNVASLKVDISVENTEAFIEVVSGMLASPDSLMEGRKLLLVAEVMNCVVSVAEISSPNSVIGKLTKDDGTNGWVVGVTSTSDISSDTETAVSVTVVKAGIVKDGNANVVVSPDVGIGDGVTASAVAELSCTTMLSLEAGVEIGRVSMSCMLLVETTTVSEAALERVCSTEEVTVPTCIVEGIIAAGVGIGWNDVNTCVMLVIAVATLDAEVLARLIKEISDEELV